MDNYFPEDLNGDDQTHLRAEAERWLKVVRKDKYAREVIRSQRWQTLADSLYTWLVDRGETRVMITTPFNDKEDMLEAVGRWVDDFIHSRFHTGEV